MGEPEIARKLYEEALTLCENEAASESEKFGDLLRLQCWMCSCLARIPAAKEECREYTKRTANTYSTFSVTNPDLAGAFRTYVDEAERVSGETV